jgi:hypothetical protein
MISIGCMTGHKTHHSSSIGQQAELLVIHMQQQQQVLG